MKMPALLIRVSIRPNREIACPTTASAVADIAAHRQDIAIAGLLEFAAIGAIFEALGEEDGNATVRPINVTVNFMRGGTQHDTFAAAIVARLGNRVANVEAHAWQADRDKPIAAAQMNVMLRRG